MNLRSFPPLAVLCLSGVASLLQAQSAVPVSQLFAFGGSTNQLAAYAATATTFGSVQAFSTPSAPFQAIPGNGRFYILANTGLTGVFSTDAQFQNSRSVGNLSLPPSAGAVSPDQKRLVVGAGSIYVFDIGGATENLLSVSGVPVTGSIIDIAISLDSTRAFVLTRAATASYVYSINLSSGATSTASPLQLPGGAATIVIGPTGWVYVTATNRLYEINGSTLQVRSGGEIGLVGTPTRPVFTPDGHYALMANTTPQIGNVSLYLVDLVARGTPQVYPPAGAANNVPTIDKILIVNNNRFLVFSSQATVIFEGTINPFNLADAQQLSLVTNVRNVTAAAISNEVPQAKYLYLIVSNQGQNILQRIDLGNNTVSGQAGLLGSNVQLQYAYVPTSLNPTTIQLLNDNQILAAGTQGIPLIARVTDASGRPVVGVPVTFTPTSTATVSPATVTTGGDGYALTTVTAPITAGAFQVSVSAIGIAAASPFSLSVPGATGGGGGGGGPATGGTYIYSGDGQLAIEFSSVISTQPLVVQVLDGKGKPVVGEPVTWTVTSGPLGLGNTQTVTDINGLASTNFGVGSINPGSAFQSGGINASTSYGSVDFVITVALGKLISGGIAPSPVLELVRPTLDTNKVVVVTAGTTTIGAIQVHAAAQAPPQSGAPIPNVGLRVVLSDTGETLTCANGRVPLTDASGFAKCDLVAPCKLGFSNINIYIGEFGYFPAGLQVNPGTATKFQLLTGNNQTGTAGQPLPLSFLALVTDSCGTPVGGQNVVWKVATGGGTLSRVISTSDSSGRVSALLTLGSTPGVTTVTVTAGSNSATFSATVNVTVAGVTPVSGGGQVGLINATFPAPVVVQLLDTQNRPIAGFPVTFAVTAGSASVNPATVNTDANGRASANVTAGSTSGNITITASAANFNTTFGLTSRLPGPSITASSFQNSASFQVGLTPCGLATVSGAGLASSIQGTVLANQFFGPLPYILVGVEITVNGIPAPIFSISNIGGKEQVSFQTPCEATPSTNGQVVIKVSGSPTTVSGVSIAAYQPGLFEYFAANGAKYAVIQKENGSYVTLDNPARRGDQLRMFVTGLGQASPTLTTNQPGVNNQNVTAPIIIGINGAGVNVISTQTVAGSIGVYLIIFEVPQDAPLNDTKVIAAVGLPNNGGLVFGNEAFIPIR